MQETLYIGKCHLSPLQRRHLGTSHSSSNHYQLPVVFSWISLMVWNLFAFKGDFSFGEKQKSQAPNLGGWVAWVIWCVSKKLCMGRDAWVGALSWWSCQSPVAHSCLLNHLNSFHGGIFKLHAKSDADSLLYSRDVKLIFTGGHISLVVDFKGLNVILGLYTCNYSLTRGKELGAAT